MGLTEEIGGADEALNVFEADGGTDAASDGVQRKL